MGKIRLVEGIGQQGGSAPRPQPGNDVWCAIDVARTKLVYCVRWGGAEQYRLSTPLGIEHVRALVERYQGCRLHVAYEACGFGYEIAWWLQAQPGVTVTVIAPSRVERPPGRAVKTDRVDAGKLASKLERGDLKGIYVPTRTLHEDRSLGRAYAQCVKERKRAQIRIRSLLQEHGHLGPLPGQGWSVYTQWLTQRALPPAVRTCVDGHLQLRATADLQGVGAQVAHAVGDRPVFGDPSGARARHDDSISDHRLVATLLGSHPQPVQLGGARSPWPHPQGWTRVLASHAVAVCLGGRAPGLRSPIECGVRTLSTASANAFGAILSTALLCVVPPGPQFSVRCGGRFKVLQRSLHGERWLWPRTITWWALLRERTRIAGWGFNPDDRSKASIGPPYIPPCSLCDTPRHK
jgi:Transposase